MRSHQSERFRKMLKSLPAEIQREARNSYKLFQQDPYHPSLHFKRIHAERPIGSVRISRDYRAVGIRQGDNIIWFWAGSHTHYEHLISKLRLAPLRDTALCCSQHHHPSFPVEGPARDEAHPTCPLLSALGPNFAFWPHARIGSKLPPSTCLSSREPHLLQRPAHWSFWRITRNMSIARASCIYWARFRTTQVAVSWRWR